MRPLRKLLGRLRSKSRVFRARVADLAGQEAGPTLGGIDMPVRFSRFVVPAALVGAALLPVAMLASPRPLCEGGLAAPKPLCEGGVRQAAQPPAATARPAGIAPTSTLSDQVDLSLTVYNSDLALVRDVRQIALASGTSTLRFADVAARVNPATVHFRSLTEPAALAVLEQNYEYDLLDPEKLLRKYVGREITIVHDRQEGGTTRAEEVKALLLADNNGPVWKIGGDIVTGLRVDQYRFPELPDNLFSHPTLVWLLENAGAARHRVEASYLSGGLSWNADYVLTVGRDDTSADLAGWVTLKNESGTSYRNAKLQFIAGEVNRVTEGRVAPESLMRNKMAMAAGAPAMQQEAFSEYHLYTLQRRTSVLDNETKQIALLASPSVPVEKRFVVDGEPFFYRAPMPPGAPVKCDVKVFYRFRNDQRAGLGVPMPAGIVRVYQADSGGGVQFAGEDRIGHTPKDETLDVHTGNAFDVVCERKQTDFKRLSNALSETEFEITLRNHKDAAVTVEVNEPIGGDWEMLSATQPWTKTGAFAARFEVSVPKGGTTVLRVQGPRKALLGVGAVFLR